MYAGLLQRVELEVEVGGKGGGVAVGGGAK